MNTVTMLFPEQDDLSQRLNQKMALFEDRLAQVVRGTDVFVDATTSHLAAAGGKRLRPLLCFLCAELGDNPDSPAVMEAALSVELRHLASLYHDDVMDEAPLRRGVPTAQKLYGNSAAIMAGDVLFARASAIVIGLGVDLAKLHVEAFERLCIGQLNETSGVPQGVDPIEHYLHVLSGKTGSLIALAARHGVLTAGGSAEIAQAAAMYGEKLGIAFQLADDVIDLISDPDATGKTPGTDLLENVSTMPTLLLRKYRDEGSLDNAGEEILALLESGTLNDPKNLSRAVELLSIHPVVDETRNSAQKWAQEAVQELHVLPQGRIRDAFESFADAMVNRIA